MTFPLNKILTISAETYVKSREDSLSLYSFRGVNYTTEYKQIAYEDFAKKVPPGTEVVTDLIISSDNNWVHLSGTALKLKKKK